LATSRCKAASARRSAFKPICRGSPLYGLALEDLRTAIVGANVAGAKGALDGAHQSYTIAANDQILDSGAYKAIIVAFRNGAPVLLSDIADVVEGLENAKVGAAYGGSSAIVIDVQRQPGVNVIENRAPRACRTAAAAALDPSRRQSHYRQRPHHDDQGLDP